ncbi:hypothetical protein GO013_03985 [Pseudodesulfovibrio sp. JC047]|uniref:hypothetical protein n=1 Tax=Pseudodesulfovibrio sp. JC047 TaxID=2683199 RepID=UPI0013D52FA2|nr:hypothetical protein [Pseudodesulfovibrio sp. JC047]NDV18579.1 hypothetical protein [Pseudodesulfovibrio sp. JC047]
MPRPSIQNIACVASDTLKARERLFILENHYPLVMTTTTALGKSRVQIREDLSRPSPVLFAPDHSLEKRVFNEQFID